MILRPFGVESDQNWEHPEKKAMHHIYHHPMCSPFTQGCCSSFRAEVFVQKEYSDKDAGHNALWNSNITVTKPSPQYPRSQVL